MCETAHKEKNIDIEHTEHPEQTKSPRAKPASIANIWTGAVSGLLKMIKDMIVPENSSINLDAQMRDAMEERTQIYGENDFGLTYYLK